MSQIQKKPETSSESDEISEISLIEILIVLAKHKRVVLGIPAAAIIFGTVFSFALPNEYRAITKLLPPQQANSGASAVLAQLGGAAAMMGASGAIKSPNDLYVGILKSRTIADKLIAKYSLQRVYDKNAFDKTRIALADNTKIASSKEGLITIEIEDEDPKRAAQIANSYVNELLSLTKVLAMTEAGQRRMFFERELTQSKENLANAEMAFNKGLDSRGVISVDAESRAVLETVGRLRAQVAAKEIQLKSMSAFVTTNNTEFKRTQEELNSLKSELANLQNGRPGGGGESGGTTNQAGLENIKVLREVKYQQMLYDLLAKQYEAARLDEAKDSAVIQVLDPAIPPERHVKPKRALITFLFGFAGLIVSVAWAFFCEGREKSARSPAREAQTAMLRKYLGLKQN